MKRLRYFIMLCVLVVITGCSSAQDTSNPTSLKVGLYPWVPRLQQFKDAINEKWNKVHPDVQLVFLTPDQWDGGYHLDPTPEMDVYVMDAMFLNYFDSIGAVSVLADNEVLDKEDFFDYAIDGSKNPNGDGYLTIPMLGCANVLFYHKNDTAMANAKTQSALRNSLGTCTFTSMIPPDARGLMIDMQGASTVASRYIESKAGTAGTYPIPLPETIDPVAMGFLKNTMNMTSYFNATQAGDNTYNRGTWYSEGHGRVFVGYTETFSAMSEQTRADTKIKPYPISDNPDAPNLFYTDLIAIHPETAQRGTRALSIELANIMANKDTILDSIGPETGEPFPQYLMPVRPSVFDTLSETFPTYIEMKNMVTESNPVIFTMDENSRNWYDAMQDKILAGTRENYPCGCDFESSTFINSNAQAQSVCPTTCADHGGWNRQWTNMAPAAPAGKSVCGCNKCPTVSELDKTPRANDN